MISDTCALWRKATRDTVALPALLLAVVVCAVAMVYACWRQTDEKMRDSLISIARVAADAFNADQLVTLEGSGKDLNSVYYPRIKVKLRDMREDIANCRFLYLLGIRANGGVFFYADSLPADSPDYAPPGYVYTDVPDAYRKTFAADTARTVGPVEDQWGRLMTALVPIKSSANNQTVAWLGMDVDARKWSYSVWRDAATPILAICVVVGSILMVILIIYNRSALRRKESNFQMLFESSDDIILVIDPDSRIIACNSTARRMLEYSKSELVGMGVLDLHKQEDRAEAEKFFTAMLKGERDACHLDLVSRNGTRIPVHTRIWLGVWSEHKCVYGLCHPLSDAEQAQRRFETVFQANPSPMAISSLPDRRFIDVNTAFTNITGYKREEVVGQTSGELGIFHDPEEQRIVAELLHKEGKITNHELRIMHKDGSVLAGLFSGVIVRDQDREYFITTMLDITEHIVMEEKLRQSQKMEAIGQLAGGVAHDFNNLLMAIMGYLELSREETGLHHAVSAWLEDAKKGCERAADIVRQLLAYSRKQAVQPRSLDLNQSVAGVLNMIRRLLGENIEVVWRPGADVGNVIFDLNQISQVLLNLAINSRDAISDSGKIVIETRRMELDREYCREHEGGGPADYALLKMTDNGCGMDAMTLSKVFDPFFTTKGVGKGTGLGLSTVYGIVKQHNGYIDIESEPGKGTGISIFIPVEKSVGEAKADDEDEWKGKCTQGAGETILVVEDDPPVREIITKELERAGYKVLQAGSGVEALRIAEEKLGEVRLLFTDMIMPGMNGRVLAEQLADKIPGIPIIFISGYARDKAIGNVLKDSYVSMLEKPASGKDIACAVDSALKQSAARSNATSE